MDLNARRVKKNDINHCSYKNSICIDAKYNFIRRFIVTPTNVHDKQMLLTLLGPENQANYVCADLNIPASILKLT